MIVYMLLTRCEQTIAISKKYTVVSHGQTRFVVVNYHLQQYELTNRWWCFRWNAEQDWIAIESGDVLKVQCYGVRLTMLNWYPCIYRIISKRKKHYTNSKNE